jgi:hypothetical protein
MRKILVIFLLAGTTLVFSYCSGTKKASKAPTVKLAYENSIQTLIVGNCSPCHIPEKGGKKKAYDNYTNVKADIDEIIRRIQLDPHERGFMPFKSPHKLSDSTIAIFKQWRDEGLAEK